MSGSLLLNPFRVGSHVGTIETLPPKSLHRLHGGESKFPKTL